MLRQDPIDAWSAAGALTGGTVLQPVSQSCKAVLQAALQEDSAGEGTGGTGLLDV